MAGRVAATRQRQALNYPANSTLDPKPSLPIRTAQLCIRPLKRQDMDARQCWPPFNDPLQLIWDMPRFSRQENDRWFARLNDRRHYLAYAVDDLDGLLIGMLSLRDISWDSSARLGIAFRSTHVGKGYGTEAMAQFLPYFFHTLGFQRMVLDVAAANLRAVRCYHKLGFHKVRSFWRSLDGPLDFELLDRPEYAQFHPFFRQRWGRVETLYCDMELSRRDWDAQQ